MTKLAEAMNQASEEIDILLVPDVKVTKIAACTPLSSRFQELQGTICQLGHIRA